MSAWLSATLSIESPSFTIGVAARLRAWQTRASVLLRPQTWRRVQEQALRVVTIVAGH